MLTRSTSARLSLPSQRHHPVFRNDYDQDIAIENIDRNLRVSRIRKEHPF